MHESRKILVSLCSCPARITAFIKVGPIPIPLKYSIPAILRSDRKISIPVRS